MAVVPEPGPSSTTLAVTELADLLADALVERRGRTVVVTGVVERPRAARRIVEILEQLVSAERVESRVHPPAA